LAIVLKETGKVIGEIEAYPEPDGTPHYENTFQFAILKKEWEKR
jgi:hypothetical protein